MLNEFPLFQVDMMRCSFHYPLHRYLAAFTCQAVSVMGMPLTDIVPPPDLLAKLMIHPLRVQVSSFFFFFLSLSLSPSVVLSPSRQKKHHKFIYINVYFFLKKKRANKKSIFFIHKKIADSIAILEIIPGSRCISIQRKKNFDFHIIKYHQVELTKPKNFVQCDI